MIPLTSSDKRVGLWKLAITVLTIAAFGLAARITPNTIVWLHLMVAAICILVFVLMVINKGLVSDIFIDPFLSTALLCSFIFCVAMVAFNESPKLSAQGMRDAEILCCVAIGPAFAIATASAANDAGDYNSKYRPTRWWNYLTGVAQAIITVLGVLAFYLTRP